MPPASPVGEREEETTVDNQTEPLRFDCPRCGRATEATYWGPCADCRDQLAATMIAEARDVQVAAFEPVMHVVPNQVATKE
jgi:hypothetical protein